MTMYHTDVHPVRGHASGGVLERRYGPEALERGFAALPTSVIDAYTALGVSRGQRALLEALWLDWRDDDGLSVVAEAVLARRIGASTRTVERYTAALCAAGLVSVVRRRGAFGERLANAYDLSPLITAAVGVARQDRPGAAPRPTELSGRATPPDSSVAHDPTPVSPNQDKTTNSDKDMALIDRDLSVAEIPMRQVVTRPVVGRGRGGHGPRPAAPQATPPAAGAMDRAADDLADRLSALTTAWGVGSPRRSIARVRAIERAAGVSHAAFLQLVDDAATRTHDYGRRRVIRNPMAYMCACLEELVADLSSGDSVMATPIMGSASAPALSPAAVVPAVWGAATAAAPDAAVPPCPSEDMADDDIDPVWRAVLGELRLDMTAANVDHWLVPARVLSRDEGVLRIGAPTPLHHHWLGTKLRPAIMRALARLGRPERLEVTLEGTEPEGAP